MLFIYEVNQLVFTHQCHCAPLPIDIFCTYANMMCGQIPADRIHAIDFMHVFSVRIIIYISICISSIHVSIPCAECIATDHGTLSTQVLVVVTYFPERHRYLSKLIQLFPLFVESSCVCPFPPVCC